jgi:fimbrial chaperone protein
MPRLLQRLCVLCLILKCTAAPAASLQISPVSLLLTGAENGKVVNLSNGGDQPIHAQVRVFAWNQADGQDRLTPTRDLIASPPIAEVPAGGEQVIRVIRASSAPVQEERTYRLLIDELPAEGSTGNNAVQFRFRYSVPLFVAPPGEATHPRLTWSIVDQSGKPFLRVRNDGAVHAQLSAVSLASGASTVPVSAGLLGYVLAGQARTWALPDAARALAATPADVMATVNGASVKAPLSDNRAP